jgi:Bacterial Ig domain
VLLRLVIALVTLLAAPVLARPVAAAGDWLAGPGAAGANTIEGSIDLPGDVSVSTAASFRVAGWLVDTSAQGWAGFDQVQVYDGPMDGGGKQLATATVGLDRPDVAAVLGNPSWSASGYDAIVPGSAIQPGLVTVYVYGHTPDRGWWYRTTYVVASSIPPLSLAAPNPAANTFPTVTISAPTSGERIPWSRGTYTLYGSAADPQAGRDVGSGIDKVTVYFYGDKSDPDRILVGEAKISGTQWSLTFSPRDFPTGHPQMYVYARSKLTGREASATTNLYLVQNE